MAVRLLMERDLPRAAAVLTSAFSGDPLMVWCCGARERPGMYASAQMTTALWTRARSAFGYFEDERLVGVALYQAPGAKVRLGSALRAGLWRWPWRAGIRGTRRIIYTFGVIDRFKAELLGPQPYWYLDTLGVERERAGRGLGPRLVLESLRELRQTRALPCFLFTHVPANVALYRRLGFEVIGECAVPNTPLTFWGMLQREPHEGPL